MIDYFPIGGINQEDPEIALKETEVRSATNFLFERRIAVQRPGVTSYALALGQRIQFGKSFDFGSSQKTLVMGTSGLWSLSSAFSATPITGAALTLGTPETLSAESVNGLIIAGGNAGGLIRWDALTGNTYTVITAAPYRYVTSHLSRVVACYKLGGADALLDPRTVACSTAGDETNWTSFGSDETVLADGPGEMTGIANVKDTIVIARTDGFHLGTPTGVSTPPFDWRLHSKNATFGCKFPSTFAASQDAVFYVGRGDVYTFALVGNPSGIGRNIRRELLGLLKAGYLYRGFVSESYCENARTHYHLVPMSAGAVLPHFSYDMEEQTWARHLYAAGAYGGWYQILGANASAPLIVQDDASGNVSVWDDSQPCESPAELRGRALTGGPLERELEHTRVLVQYRSFSGDVEGVTATLSASGASGFDQTDNTQTLYDRADGKWARQWFNVRVTGAIPSVDISVPAGSRLALNYIGIVPRDGGEFRS